MTWEEVSGGTVILSTGSFEQHGPHLPLSTDSLIARAVAVDVADVMGAILGPALPLGVSPEHMGFAGTITLDMGAFQAMVSQAVESLKKHGFDRVILINGHGGNNAALLDMEGFDLVNLTTLIKPYDHAGDVETSLMMHIAPELVRQDKIREHEFSWPGKDWKDTRDHSESGVLGDPTGATTDKGEKILADLVARSLDALS